MTSPGARAALRKMLIDLSVMTVLGVVLAIIGPFGTFTLPFAWRLVYWVVLGWGGYACYRPIAEWVVRTGRPLDLPEPASWIAATLIATVPMSALVWWVGRIGRPFALPSLELALTMYGYVLVIGGMLTTLFYFVDRRNDAAAAPVRFLERVPRQLGTDLIALQMEDHYLRIHTRLGSDLILMRMRDAVAELDGLEGAQVHRSWWVARGAVQRVERDGRNVRLVLDNGPTVPVARDAAAQLKAAGWL